MARHQDVQKRLRDALRKAHSAALEEDRWPTMSEINGTSIAYLDAVLEETTRYAAVATIIAREATCDTQILGCPIPKGTTIMLLLTGPSLKEAPASIPDSLRTSGCLDAKDKVALWDDDGANYRPERWLKRERDDTTGIESEAFDPLAGPTLAFSVGPRQCFGRKLAYMQLRAFMTLLAWNFNFGTIDETLDSDEPVEKMINIPQDCYIKVSKA
jgi:cytochrome P450